VGLKAWGKEKNKQKKNKPISSRKDRHQTKGWKGDFQKGKKRKDALVESLLTSQQTNQRGQSTKALGKGVDKKS